MASPHLALGTNAVAVAANALANVFSHARRGNVRWRCAAIYTSAGVAGAYLGAFAADQFPEVADC